jgi:hypothetical protein
MPGSIRAFVALAPSLEHLVHSSGDEVFSVALVNWFSPPAAAVFWGNISLEFMIPDGSI